MVKFLIRCVGREGPKVFGCPKCILKFYNIEFSLLIEALSYAKLNFRDQLIIVLTYVFRGMNKYIFPLLFFVCFIITNAAIPKEKYLFVEIPDKDLGSIHKGHHAIYDFLK